MKISPAVDTQFEKRERAADRRSRVPQMPFNPADTSDAWLEHARCARSDTKLSPDAFHPDGSVTADEIAALEEVCASCPVMAACRAFRYDTNAVGFYAGVRYPINSKPRRRCAIRGCSKHTPSPQRRYCGFDCEHAAKVGTTRGYDLHVRNGVPPCDACGEGRWGYLQSKSPTAGAGAPRRNSWRNGIPGKRVAS